MLPGLDLSDRSEALIRAAVADDADMRDAKLLADVFREGRQVGRLGEFAAQAHRICRAGNLPLLCDADHGYGNALNVMRTVRDCERLVVEGAVVSDLIQAAEVEIAIGGVFQGGIEVVDAVIAGTIEGTVTDQSGGALPGERSSVACPADAIYLEPAENDGTVMAGPRYAKIYQIHKTRCIFCGYCEEACPVGAIFMGKDYELALYSKDDFVWDKTDLLVPASTTAPTLAQGR